MSQESRKVRTIFHRAMVYVVAVAVDVAVDVEVCEGNHETRVTMAATGPAAMHCL